MRKAILILRREISVLTRSKVFPILIVIILLFLCGLFPEAKRYTEHALNSDLVLEYQKAIFTLAVATSILLPIGVGRVMLSIIGATLLVKEFESNTMSTLGCLPIKRESIFLGKFLAITIVSLFVALFYGFGTWIICILTLGYPPFNLVFFTVFFIFVGCLYFASLSIFVSSFFKSSTPAILLALGLIYLSGFFVFAYPAQITDREKWLPEYYIWALYNHLFFPEEISSSTPSFYTSILVILFAILLLLAISSIIFKSRDI